MQAMIGYVPIVLVLAPWLIYTIGAALRFATRHERIYRDQMVLATLAFLGTTFTWVHYDSNFGLDPFGIEEWSSTVDIVETWLFRGAVFFFILALIPDTKLIPTHPWWRQIGMSLSIILIICGTGAAWYLSRNVSLPWLELPWSVARGVFSVSFIPHSIGYLALSGKIRMERGNNQE